MVLEDFTTYTEVDTAGDLTVGQYRVDAGCWNDSTDGYLYKDFGAGYFTDFTHHLEIGVVGLGSANSRQRCCYGLANEVKPTLTLLGDNDTFISVQTNVVSGTPRYFIREYYNGSSYQDYYSGPSDTTYYCTVTKTGTAYQMILYSDASRTTVVDTLNLTLHANHSLRYCYGSNNYNSANHQLHNGWTENLDLNPLAADYPMSLQLQLACKGSVGRPPLGTGGGSFGG